MLNKLLSVSLSLFLINVAVADHGAKGDHKEAATTQGTGEIVLTETTVSPEPAAEKEAAPEPSACDQLDAMQTELRAQSASIEIQGRALTDQEFEQLGRHHSARFHLARAKSALGCTTK